MPAVLGKPRSDLLYAVVFVVTVEAFEVFHFFSELVGFFHEFMLLFDFSGPRFKVGLWNVTLERLDKTCRLFPRALAGAPSFPLAHPASPSYTGHARAALVRTDTAFNRLRVANIH
jgi:hypothetical protein